MCNDECGRLSALIFGGVFLAAVFAWWMSLAPRPLPADAPATEFSAYRALEHVKATAVETHPGGSHANEKLYGYLAAQLEAMDVEMAVERPIMRRGKNTVEQIGAILARVPGTDSTGALAVDAHFDSTPYGPGAADDISGVAAMLETIRALKAGPPLRNDTLFCFADKEEMGGPGGPAVFIAHPWFEDVRAVLGLETRGTSGPALMFETGSENGFVIRQMAQSASYPRATSIMFDFYDRMPFGSDFSRYKKLPNLSGLNVAYIDDFCDYHTKLDTPENVSLASLQHLGAYTLGMAKQLGGVSLENTLAPNATFFNTIGSHMVVYPLSWGWPLTSLAIAVFAAVLVLGFVRKRLDILGVLAGMGTLLFATVLSFAATVPLSYLVFQFFREHALYRNNTFSISIVLVGLGIFVLMARLVRGARPQSLFAGVLLLWAIALLGMQTYFPGGAYSLTWPLLFMSLGLLALLFSGGPERPSHAGLATAAASVVPGVLLLAPTLVVLSYALTAVAMPVCGTLVLLLAAPLLPQMSVIPLRRHMPIGLLFLVAGGILFVGGVVTNTPSADRPRQNCLAYAVDFDADKAFWLSGDSALDEWTNNYFDEEAPRANVNAYTGGNDADVYLKAPAPMPPFGKTVLKVLDDRVKNGRRKLRLFVDSPRDAQEIHLTVTNDAPIHKAKVLGINIPGRKKGWYLHLNTIPFEGGEIILETDPGKPIRFRAREVSFELPEIEGFIPRPAHMMTETNRRLIRGNDLKSSHTYSLCTIEI